MRVKESEGEVNKESDRKKETKERERRHGGIEERRVRSWEIREGRADIVTGRQTETENLNSVSLPCAYYYHHHH